MRRQCFFAFWNCIPSCLVSKHCMLSSRNLLLSTYGTDSLGPPIFELLVDHVNNGPSLQELVVFFELFAPKTLFFVKIFERCKHF